MPHKTNLRLILILSMLVAVGPMATDLYLPAFPNIAKYFDTSSSYVQLTMSAYLIGFALGQLILGPLSDRFGRKPIIISGLLLFIVCSIAATFASSIEVLIFIRLLQALGGCVGPVLGRSMVRDLYNPKDAALMLSHIGTAMALAPATAPIIGSYLTALFGWKSNFWFLFIYGLIALLVEVFLMKETITQKNPKATKVKSLITNYHTLIKHREWLVYTLICSFSYAGLFAFLSGSPFVLIEYFGVLETSYGYLFAIIVMGYMLGSQITVRLVNRISPILLIKIGCCLSLVSGGVMFVLSALGFHSIFNIIAPHFFYMITVGIILPLAMAGAMAPFPHMAGAASALFGMLQMSIAAIYGAFIGYLHTGTPTAMAGGIALAGLMCFVLMLLLEHIKKQPNTRLTHCENSL